MKVYLGSTRMPSWPLAILYLCSRVQISERDVTGNNLVRNHYTLLKRQPETLIGNTHFRSGSLVQGMNVSGIPESSKVLIAVIPPAALRSRLADLLHSILHTWQLRAGAAPRSDDNHRCSLWHRRRSRPWGWHPVAAKSPRIMSEGG